MRYILQESLKSQLLKRIELVPQIQLRALHDRRSRFTRLKLFFVDHFRGEFVFVGIYLFSLFLLVFISLLVYLFISLFIY